MPMPAGLANYIANKKKGMIKGTEVENKKETIAEKGIEEPGTPVKGKKAVKPAIAMSDSKKKAMEVLMSKSKK